MSERGQFCDNLKFRPLNGREVEAAFAFERKWHSPSENIRHRNCRWKGGPRKYRGLDQPPFISACKSEKAAAPG
jgi:hypothetical protein